MALLLGMVLPGLAVAVTLSSHGKATNWAGVSTARGLSGGTTAWLIGTGLLARTVGLSAQSVWALAGALGASGVVVLLVPRRNRVWLRGSLAALAAVVLVALSTLAVWLPVIVTVLGHRFSLLGSTPWYYFGLARQTAALGHVPSTSIEWGTSAPFLDDYHLLTVATAALIRIGPHDSLQAAFAFVAVTVVVAGCGIAALARTLGASRTTALVAPALFLAVDLFAGKLTSYRPEIFATALLFPMTVLALSWFRERHLRDFVLGALAFAMVSQVHGLMFFIAAALVASAALATFPGWRPDRSFARHAGSAALVGVAWSAVVVALAFVFGSKIGSQNANGLTFPGSTQDPTWEFVRAITGRDYTTPPSSITLAKHSLTRSFAGTSPVVLFAVAALALLALAWVAVRAVPRGRRSWNRFGDTAHLARRLLLFVLAFTLASAAMGAVFAFGWPTYVPRRAGAKRLIQVLPMVLPLLAAVSVTLVCRRLRRPPARRGLAVGSCVAALALGVVGSAATAHDVGQEHPSAETVDALRSLDLPRGAVVATNGYVEGTLTQLTGANVLTGGRAPYTYPDLLARATGLLRASAAYFTHPRTDASFLTEENVDYVIFAVRGTWATGTSNTFRPPAPAHALRSTTGLEVVAETPDLVVARVVADDTRSQHPGS